MRILAFAVTAAVLGLSACGGDDGTGAEISTDANAADDAALNDVLGGNMDSPAQSAAMPTDAQGFANAAAASDLYEIESAKLALEKAQSADLRGFAQKLQREHEQSTAQLKSAAAGANVTVTPALDAEKQAMIDELKAASGAEFDSTFLNQQRNAHQRALMLMQNYQAGGDNESLKSFASTAQSLIEGHLDHLNAMR